MSEGGSATTIAEALEVVLGAAPAWAVWTEQQWAEHERQLAQERAQERARQGEARRRALRVQLLDQGCPARDVAVVLDGGLRGTSALEHAQSALRDAVQTAILAGPTGIGKTVAATWWLSRSRSPAARRTEPARFVTAGALSRWPRYSESRMAELFEARALVIDDLAVEYLDKPGAFGSLLDELLNARYARELPTMCTTNLAAAEFRARYGDRVADRIRQCGRFSELSGASLRRPEHR